MSSWTVLASLLLLGASGCGADGGRLPPPSPASSTGLGGGGGGGGGAPVTPPNVCECAHAAIAGEACGSCVNGAAAAGCIAESQACDADDGCKTIASCPKTCNGLPAAEKPACAQKCVLDNQDSASFPLYVALMDCVCSPCAKACAPDEPLACE